MLTEREVLAELRRIGIKEPFLVKNYLGEFEEYMAINYGEKIIKKEKRCLKIKNRIKKQ
jgi:hypothetical protein